MKKNNQTRENVILHKYNGGEIWIKTWIHNKNELTSLADSGSQVNFVKDSAARQNQHENPQVKGMEFRSDTKYKCQNNKDKDRSKMILKSGSWTAKECKLLVVNLLTHNLMGRDILRKLGYHSNKQIPGKHINSISNDEIIKKHKKNWVFNSYAHIYVQGLINQNTISQNKRLKRTFHMPTKKKESPITSPRKVRTRTRNINKRQTNILP